MSEDSNHIINVLLIKYLLQEATDDEILHVEEWIALSNDNKQYLDHFKLILNGSKTNKATTSLTEEEAWKRFEKRLDTTTSLINNKNKYSKIWYRVAALVILTFGIGLLVYNFLPKGETVKLIAVRSTDAVLSDTLPDQSVITLNKNSQITYNSTFEKDSRTVTLKGEAFFNVTPDKNKPFIIHVNDITVKVLGTSFNIRTKGTVTEVIVETGVVQVIKNKKTVLIQPKEKVLLQQHDTILAKERVKDELYNYYRSKEFVCDNTPLWKLVEVLNEAYASNITIERKSLRALPLTTTFNNESLETILQIISVTFSIEIERRGDQILLK